jgi:hypothetical protein
MTKRTIPINYDLLRDVCLASIEDFAGLPGFTKTETPDGVYYFKDNGSQVLAVAHLDSVQDTQHFHKIDIKGRDYVLNAQLDDRLGAYTILHLLPSMGFKYDILLTEGEEMGRSTAAYFQAPKGRQYNWMFSFDRNGDDVVMYQYDCSFARRKLKEADLKPGHGTFSDIAFLDELGCIGFNVGVGYDNEHSAWAIMDVDVYRSQVRKFTKFYNLFKKLFMYYTPAPKTYTYVTKDGATVTRRYNNQPLRGVGSEWARYDEWEDDPKQFDADWFYKNHKWDAAKSQYIYTGHNKALPAPADPIDVTNYEVCAICGLPPRDIDLAVAFGAHLICSTCVPYATQCDVCNEFVRDTDMTDGMCLDCIAEINADLDLRDK